MNGRVTRGKLALYSGWLCLAGSVVIAGRSDVLSGLLLVPAGLLFLVGARSGVVAEYNGWPGARPLPENQVRVVSAAFQTLAVFFVLIGVLLIARG